MNSGKYVFSRLLEFVNRYGDTLQMQWEYISGLQYAPTWLSRM